MKLYLTPIFIFILLEEFSFCSAVNEMNDSGSFAAGSVAEAFLQMEERFSRRLAESLIKQEGIMKTHLLPLSMTLDNLKLSLNQLRESTSSQISAINANIQGITRFQNSLVEADKEVVKANTVVMTQLQEHTNKNILTMQSKIYSFESTLRDYEQKQSSRTNATTNLELAVIKIENQLEQVGNTFDSSYTPSVTFYRQRHHTGASESIPFGRCTPGGATCCKNLSTLDNDSRSMLIWNRSCVIVYDDSNCNGSGKIYSEFRNYDPADFGDFNDKISSIKPCLM